MAPPTDNPTRNRAEERVDLDAYEQPMSEKAGLLTEMAVTLQYVQRDLGEVKTDLKALKGQFVTKDELDARIKLIERIVYGLVALILVSVFTAIASLVIRHKASPMTHLLRSFFQAAALPILLVAALVILYFSYLLLWPTRVVELTHSPIRLREHTLSPGQELHYVLEYCKHQDIPAAVEFTLVGDAAVPTLTSYRNLPLACPGTKELGVVVPLSTPPGRYRVVLVNRYRINQLRTDTNTWETEPFDVVRP